MKKLLALLLSVIMVFSLCACSSSDGEKSDETKDATAGSEGAEGGIDPNTLYAGFCRVQCIPDDPLVHIAGGTAVDDPATDGLLDDLSVTCVALQKNGETYLINTCDIVDMESFYKAVEKTVASAVGLHTDNVIFNATHTHSAPTLKSGDINLPGAANYLTKFTDCCTEAAKDAIKDLSPVSELSYGSIMTENMVRVRHYRMKDGTTHGNGHGSATSGYESHLYPSDEECQVIRISRSEDKDIVLFNLGAHATIVSGTNTSALSADFPFPARQYIESQGDFEAAYFIAAAGDQTPGSKIAGEIKNKNHNDYGKQLGDYVIQCLNNNMTVSTGTDISFYTENYVAKRNKDGVEDTTRLQQASEIIALRKQYGGSVTKEVKAKIEEYGFNSIYEASSLVSRSGAPATGHFPISTMLLGDIGLCFFAGEMFGSQGRQLKDDSPVFAFVITNSEDDQGYFPNATGKEENFYEYQITKYEMGTGEAVAARYVETLEALKNGTTPAPLPEVK